MIILASNKIQRKIKNRRYQLLTALIFASFIGVAHAQLNYTTSWIGNSFPGGSTNTWIQSAIADMYVMPDGRTVTNSLWDEMGGEGEIFYNNGTMAPPYWAPAMHDCGGKAVAATSSYIFMGIQCGSSAPFGFRKYDWSGNQVGTDVTTSASGTGAYVAGLAVSADGNILYVSDPATNLIRLYSTSSLSPLSSFAFTSPGRLTVDTAGTLWIVQTTTNQILHYSTSGTALGGNITGVGNPTALAIDNQGRLMVGDSGPNQQILFFSTSSSQQVATFGVTGGIYSGNQGQTGDQKLISPTGLGTDSAGNIYVSSTIGGAEIRKFSPAGVLQWHLEGLEFVDTAVADPATDGLDVYTKRQHFTMDYSQSNGKEATWAGMTVQTLKYPTDPRLSLPYPTPQELSILAVRTINGQKYMFTTDQFDSELAIFRLVGDTAIPAGMIWPGMTLAWMPGIVPQASGFIWNDLNGDGNIQSNEFTYVGGQDLSVWGWSVDMKGNVWQAAETNGVRFLPLQGTDSNGNPIYDHAHLSALGIPAPFTSVERVEYDSDSDTMYLGGYTAANPIGSGYWGQVGTTIARYNNWSTGNRTALWTIILPYDPTTYHTIKAFAVAGNMVFAALYYTSSTANIYVYDARTGASLGQLLPGTQIGRELGAIDGGYNLRAYQRSNGEYEVFEEDDAFNKVIMYRVQPTGSQGSTSGGGTSSVTSVSTSPSTTTLGASATQQFIATVTGSTNTAVTFSLSPAIGSISASGLYTAPASISSNTTVRVTATSAADPTKSASATVSLTAGGSADPPFTAIRINAGGGGFTDPATGNVWSADTGGTEYTTTQTVTDTANPSQAPLYQSQRYGTSQYQFSVPNGTYTVNLKFAEIYFTQAGQRVFDVVINGQTVLSKFDIVAAAGAGFTAVDRSFTVGPTSQITIQFNTDVNNAAINAIEILPATFNAIRIHAGGSSYTDPSGYVWMADTGFNSGSPYATSAAIAGSNSSPLYQTVRYNPSGFTYQFAVPNGSYGVNLKFAEIYYTQPGQRVFDVLINGIPVLSNFDIVAQAGAANTAVDRLFTVRTTNGQIVIQFTPVTDAPMVNALAITAAPATAIRVNAGGPAYTDPLGQAWSADTGFNTGNLYTTTAAISGGPTPTLYQTVHWNGSAFQYQTAVPNGNYAVTLKFAEVYYTSPGQRVFNVSINGQAVLTNFDALTQGGKPDAAIDKTFYASVTGGQMVIQFQPVAGEPDVSAIQIVSQ